MLNKIYDKLRKFIKENYKSIIILFIIFVIFNYPLNYSIMVSGGTISIDDRIEMDNSYKSKGSFNMAYVTELKSTVVTTFLSYIIPSWTKVPLDDYKASKKETASDIAARSKLYLEYSKQSSVKVAYEASGKEFIKNDNKFYVSYILDEAETNLKTGDILKTIDGITILEVEDYKNTIKSHEYGDKVYITVERNGKEVKTYAVVKKIDDEKMVGVSVLNLYDYETDPEIKIKFKGNESGSSGGLMLALAIYDKLNSKDITNGKKIVGTGTIDFEGNVGEIDGVEYKLKGAVKSKADIFIAPKGSNYDKCIELKNKYKYNIEIISAETFIQVLDALENYGG